MKRWILIVLLAASAAGGFWYWNGRRPSEGPYGLVSLRLNENAKEECDRTSAPRRLGLSRLVDRYRERIHGLWESRAAEEFPEYKMEQVGPVFLRVNPEGEKKSGYDKTSWSWEEAHSLFLRTQREAESRETKQRWRDLDTTVRFLLERDVARILSGRKFLPPDETSHSFRPGPSVRRVSRDAFEVSLDAGDFLGAEKKLASVLEKEWSGNGKRVKVRWVPPGPGVYRVLAYFQSGRSFVNHQRKVMVIANFSWARTVAHELGHILGFDDHYYSVWNGRNCYYTQESRMSDLMSNSEFGRVTGGHWGLLDLAYPWKGEPMAEPFGYFFRDTN